MDQLFKQKTSTSAANLESKYNKSIANLLLVAVFTLINIVLLLIKADSYFLFSAFIPYFAVDYGMFYCGMYPEEFYYDMGEIEFFDSSFLIFTVAAAGVMLLLYMLSWFFAKKKKLWALVGALIFFTIDTLAMFLISGFSLDSLLDIIFHIWVIAYLIIAISTLYKIKNAPPETEEEQTEAEIDHVNSSPLRAAEDAKSRVFLETDAAEMHIVYRRVKHTNELIINGYVYDEYEAIAEFAHTLAADINGHRIEAGFDGRAKVFINLDCEEIAKKTRLL